VYTLAEWLALADARLKQVVSSRISTAVIYLNGTRRWFLSRSDDWSAYATITSQAQRALNQTFFDYGLQTLIQPVLGYDLVSRGPEYMAFALEQGLAALANSDSQAWYQQHQIRVTFYGNWPAVLDEHGFTDLKTSLQQLEAETAQYSQYNLLFGLFADEGLDRVVELAKQLQPDETLLTAYYGQPVGPVDLIVGSGQPGIWDLPLLDINQANMYFLQAPTFCLTAPALRRILYDHLYQRKNDDELYDHLAPNTGPNIWQDFEILGIGRQTNHGWEAV